MKKWVLATGCAWLTMSAGAWASETPLYQPAPSWVAPSPPIAIEADDGASAMVLFDSQRRLENGKLWSFVDTATRMVSAEMLGQAGTVSIPWSPDQGDLIVHRIEIMRGAERIDLVKGGQRFSVLRREEGLERRELTGLLTATLPVQGLQIGDVLRLAFSITAVDPALRGKAQALMPLLAAPLRAGFARARVQWPTGEHFAWKLHGEGAPAQVANKGGWNEVTLAMPLPKQPEMPVDAPSRFRRPPMLEMSSFKGWADVSRAMAPLFASEGLIRPGDPLDGEVKRIMAATPDPTARAGRALELVQEKVRYLLMGMAGGNYTPQAPGQTWAMRYGDCKAKTLMLLAMLRSMGIEAEAVLANSSGGDALPERLPMPGAFDHVLVRATIGDRSLWLDGTGTGSRLADIHDTPALRHVLPLRAGGADLVAVPMRAPARPNFEASLEVDESAAVDMPSLFKATMVLRGPAASQVAMVSSQAAPEQKREMVGSIVGNLLRDATLSDYTLRYDPAAAEATIDASGLFSSGWSRQEKRFRRELDRAVSPIDFNPNRARPAWTAIPVASPDPQNSLIRTRIKLPDGGRGFTIDGDRDFTGTLGGQAVRRTTSIENGLVVMVEQTRTDGREIAIGDVPAERARLTLAKARLPKVVAPADVTQYWQATARPEAAATLTAIETSFAKAVAADAAGTSALHWRARYRSSIGDRRGAIGDYDRALKIDPTAELLLARAEAKRELGQDKAALLDVEEALKLDPSSENALVKAAEIRADLGDGAAALTMLQEKIDLGGKARFLFMRVKADIQSNMGDTAGAIATMDAAISDSPGNPDLLNERCWIKGSRAIALESALKDCTKAIELSDDPAGALDSRAMVYLRMKRFDDALTDLDAALDVWPGMAASLYLRGVIRAKTGKADGAAADLSAARMLSPRIDVTYKRFGLAP